MVKMNKEQKAMFNGLTSLQQEIALNSLSGMNDIDSYRNSNGKAVSESAQRAGTCEILANPSVKEFIEIMKENAVNNAIMSRERMLELQTKIADIGNAELGLITLESLNELKGALDIKLKAMNQLADLAGYKSATKHDLTSSDGSMSPSKNMTDDELLKIASE